MAELTPTDQGWNMRLHFALLARYANFDTEGTFGILGGGALQIIAPAFPVSAQLTFVAQALLTPEERKSEHSLRLEIYNEAGEKAPNEWEIPVPRIPDADVPAPLQAKEWPFTALFNLGGMAFPQAGLYRFRVLSETGKLGEDVEIPVTLKQ